MVKKPTPKMDPMANYSSPAFLLNSTSIINTADDLDYDGGTDSSDIAALLGPKRDPLYIVVPITVMYFLIFVTGVIGNVSTCIVISRNKSMHTATNYYLFSLAISDLLLLLAGLPQEMWSIWSRYPYVFGEAFCIIRGLAAETSANATVLTITAFTIERYVAICHPFLSHTMSKLSRAVKFILIVWVISLSFALPQALQFGIVRHHDMDICHVKRIILEHSFELSTFLFFVTPMTLITVLYALIGCRLRASSMMKREISMRHRRNKEVGACVHSKAKLSKLANGDKVAADGNLVRCDNSGRIRDNSRAANGSVNSRRRIGKNPSHGQSSRRVLKMLVAVVVAFFICWAPFHAQRLVAIYGPTVNPHQTEPSRPFWMTVYTALTYVSGVLYYASTCVNPLLYNIMSNKFREAFKETLSRTCPCCGTRRDACNASPLGGAHTGSGRYSALARGCEHRTPSCDTNIQVNTGGLCGDSATTACDAMRRGGSRMRLSEAHDSSISYSGNSQSYRADELSQSQNQSCAINASSSTTPSLVASSYIDHRCARNSTDSGRLITGRKLLGNGKTLRRIWQRLAKHNRSGSPNANMVHNDISTSVSTHMTEVKIDPETLHNHKPTLADARTDHATRREYFDTVNSERLNGNGVSDCDELTCYMRELQRRELQRR